MCEIIVDKNEKKEKIEKPKLIKINSDILEEIETQSLRIKLISQSLKNPKKDYTRL